MNIMKIPTLSLLLSTFTLSAIGQEPVTYYDWQFDEEAGSIVFSEVSNSGIGTNGFGSWLDFVTDGSGNWVVDGNIDTGNKYSGMEMFMGGGIVTDGVWVATMSIKGWELTSDATSTIMLGFTDSANNHTQVKIANGATQVRLVANSNSFVGNFGNDSHSSSAFVSDGQLREAYNGGATAVLIEGAPAIAGNSVIHLKATIDLDADTYDLSYAVDGGEFFTVETGAYTSDIQKFRLATVKFGAGDFILVEGITVTGTGTAPTPMWNGFEMDENGWVDTGAWLGLVNVTNDPWIWNESISGYMYMPNDSGWAYVTN
jgi:hypothetical protein